MHLIKLRQTPVLLLKCNLFDNNTRQPITIHFCMKHINHSLLLCLITVSPRENNNSFKQKMQITALSFIAVKKKLYPYHTNINRNKRVLYPFYQTIIIKQQIKFKALKKLDNDNIFFLLQ